MPWEREMFIDRPPFNFPLLADPHYRVRVSSRSTGFRSGQTRRRHGFRQCDLATQGNRVPKNRNLVFKAQTNVSGPYELYWKVRNGGEETRAANALRGEISKDQGNLRRKEESTLYRGTHYVECYVVQNGIVVAKDRHTVIVT